MVIAHLLQAIIEIAATRLEGMGDAAELMGDWQSAHPGMHRCAPFVGC
jgi:hypothetical protein